MDAKMDVKHVKQLSTPKGFIRRYLFHLNKGGVSQTEAYEQTETEYNEIFERRRYSSYDSFRQIKNRIIRLM